MLITGRILFYLLWGLVSNQLCSWSTHPHVIARCYCYECSSDTDCYCYECSSDTDCYCYIVIVIDDGSCDLLLHTKQLWHIPVRFKSSSVIIHTSKH